MYMQFRVPQNITMEDRIVGSLTMIQFGILIVGGGISFLVFSSRSIPAPFNMVGGGFFGLLTLILTWGRFNDQPMYRFFKFILAYIFSPKTRVWHKSGRPEVPLIRPTSTQSNTTTRKVKRVTKEDIAQLSQVLDTRGQAGIVPTPLDPNKPAKPKS